MGKFINPFTDVGFKRLISRRSWMIVIVFLNESFMY